MTGRTPCVGRTRWSQQPCVRCGSAGARLAATLVALALAPVARAEARQALGLEECLALAAERSPASIAERERLAQAVSESAIARSALLPRVTGSAYAIRLNEDRLSPLGVAPAAAAPTLYDREAFAAVRGKWIVFDGLRGWNAHTAAQRGVDAARGAVTLTGADVRLAVTQAFYRLVAAQELTSVAERAAARQVAFEELAVALADAGRGSRVDPLRARAQRLDAERALVAAREAEGVAAVQLGRAIGLDASERLTARGALPARTDAPDGDAEVALAVRVLSSSADLARLDLLIAQARASARAAHGTWFPELSAQASYGWRARDPGGNAAEWTAGAYAEWPLFESGAGYAGVKRAEARVRELEASRRSLRLAIEADLHDALAAWRSASAAALSTADAAEASRAALEAATALYRNGRVGALDVLTAQLDLARAEGARTQALADVAIAQARVERLAGGT